MRLARRRLLEAAPSQSIAPELNAFGVETYLALFARYFSLFEEKYQDRWIRLGLLMTVVGWAGYLFYQLTESRAYIDWMFISAGVVFFPTVFFSLGSEAKLRSALEETITNGAIDYAHSGATLYREIFNGVVEKYRGYLSILIVTVEVSSWFWTLVVARMIKGAVFSLNASDFRLQYVGGDCSAASCSLSLIQPMALLFAMIVCSVMAGSRIGTMIALGGLGRRLRNRKIGFRVVLGHADKAGGFEQIGEFFRRQALLLGMLTLWLSIWWLLAPGFDGAGGIADYRNWHASLFLMWLLSIVFLVFAFFEPLWLFQAVLARNKREQIDALRPRFTNRLRSLAAEIRRGAGNETLDVFSQSSELILLQERFEQFRKTPSLPVNHVSIVRFLAPVISLVFSPLAIEYTTKGFASFGTLIPNLRELGTTLVSHFTSG